MQVNKQNNNMKNKKQILKKACKGKGGCGKGGPLGDVARTVGLGVAFPGVGLLAAKKINKALKNPPITQPGKYPQATWEDGKPVYTNPAPTPAPRATPAPKLLGSKKTGVTAPPGAVAVPNDKVAASEKINRATWEDGTPVYLKPPTSKTIEGMKNKLNQKRKIKRENA